MAEEVVHVNECKGGKTTVPAGSRIVLLFGWKAKNEGLVQSFLNAQTTTISPNGAAPIDVSDSYSAIEKIPAGGIPEGGSVSRVRYDTGVTLSAGESLQADGTTVVSHTVIDLFDEDTHKPVFSNPAIHKLSAAALPPRRESRVSSGVLLMAVSRCDEDQ
jgi:hypothetical protein